jgi:hypothetical protein
MTAIIMITTKRTIKPRNASECRNTENVFQALSAALSKAGSKYNFPSIITRIATIIRAKNQYPPLSEFFLLIEAYQPEDHALFNKFFSVKAPSRFTNLWAAVKENLYGSKKKEVL